MAADAARYGNSIGVWYSEAFPPAGKKTTTAQLTRQRQRAERLQELETEAVPERTERKRHTSIVCFALLPRLVPMSCTLRSIKETLPTGVPDSDLLRGKAFEDLQRSGTERTNPAHRHRPDFCGSRSG